MEVKTKKEDDSAPEKKRSTFKVPQQVLSEEELPEDDCVLFDLSDIQTKVKMEATSKSLNDYKTSKSSNFEMNNFDPVDKSRLDILDMVRYDISQEYPHLNIIGNLAD